MRLCVPAAVLSVFFPVVAFSSEQTVSVEPIVVRKNPFVVSAAYRASVDAVGNGPALSFWRGMQALPADAQSRGASGAIQADIALRAAGYHQTLLLLDGVRLNDPQTGHHSADLPVTAADIERLEMVNPAAGIRFGPDALSGAINIALKKPRLRQRFLQAGLGLFRDGYGLASVAERGRDWGMRVSAERAQSKGFRPGTDFRTQTFSSAAEFTLPAAEGEVLFGHNAKEFGAYDFYTPGLGYPSKERTATTLLSTRVTFAREGFSWRPSFVWRRHEDTFFLDRSSLRSRFRSDHRSDRLTPGVYLQRPWGEAGTLGCGGEYEWEGLSSTTLGNRSRGRAGFFGAARFPLSGALDAAISGRCDTGMGIAAAGSGSLGVLYKPAESIGLSAEISRTVRVPTFTELYYDDPTTVGEASLHPESAWNYVLGFAHERAAGALTASLFVRREEGSIDWVKSNMAQTRFRAMNLPLLTAWGGEINATLRLSQQASCALLYAAAVKGEPAGERLYKYGRNYAQHFVRVSSRFISPLGTHELQVSYKKKPGRIGWALVEVRSERALTRNLTLFLLCTNLFNTEYQEIAGIASPGRGAEAGLRLEW